MENNLDPISFKDVAFLVNRTGTRIDVDSPRLIQPDQYAVYGGTVSSSGFSFEFEILYLYSDATKEGVRPARSWLNRKTDKSRVRVVYAPSITLSIVEEVRQLGVECMSLAEYFASFMRQQTETYISKIRQLSFADYIDPQIECPVSLRRRNPNPVLGFMTTPEYSASKGEIAVLLGEPGQGKTHMSKYLAVELTKMKHIPVYVHSEQWTKMQVEDMSSIWKTIVASFRYFDAPIGWAEGVEREFIRVSLKLGIFRLIFDGFDEFILWNRGTIDARESLRELLNLAEETGTTLCITSRSSFYRSEISDEADKDNLEKPDKLFEFTICPFDVNHARNYFIKRFGADTEEMSTSVRLFERLKQDSSNDAMSFVGRGFFLSLIADLVNRGFKMHNLGMDGRTRLQWIMEALCQREQTRQTLPLDAASQLNVFREFADLAARGEARSSTTLRFVLEATTELDSLQIDQLIKNPVKLKDHPLIGFSRQLNTWQFTQDQIEYVLLAERVLELCSNSTKYVQLAGLLNGPDFAKSLHTEVATSIVQQVFELRTHDEALERCKELISAISQASRSTNIESRSGCHQFAGRLALLAAGKAHERGSDRTERTNALLKLLPAGQLEGAQFVGTMAGLDLRGLTISGCHFDTVTFANCRFSDTTRFINCRFTELRVTNSEQFGRVQWNDSNTFDELSRRLVEAEMISSGERGYAEVNLQADVDCLVRKFLPRETTGFKNVEERNLSRGLIGHSIHKNQIIETFTKSCLECHPVNGNFVFAVLEKAKSDFVFFVGNGVMTGELARLKDELRRKLSISV